MRLGPIVAGGDCLVREPGQKTTFVSGGIPGELVDVNVYDERKDLDRADVTNVVEPSPLRIIEPCPVRHKGCGGCQWQHIEFNQHAEYKTGIVRDALDRIAKMPDASINFAGSISPFDYRTTMRLPIVNGKAALHKLHSNETVTLDTCLIAHPLLRELIIEGDFADATEVRLRVSNATSERIAWITGGTKDPTLPEDVVITKNGRKAPIHEDVNGMRSQVSARAFFQSCPQAAELIVNTVDKHCPAETHIILDAYCGVGVLGAVLTKKRGGQLIAIEIDGASANDAKANLESVDARIVLGEVAAVRPTDTGTPSVIVADPARSGLGKSATRALANLEAPKFILVSCDPASLARDVTPLNNNGYDLDVVEVLDLFPQTHHVETVSVFSRR